MALLYKNFKVSLINSAPLLLLYYLSISEIDTQFSNMFEILSFNLQIIIIYYWTLKDESIIGTGHIFFVGIINDVVMGLPLGLSAITYLVVSFVGNYVKNVTVNFSLFTDWFTFLIAIFFSNLSFMLLIYNFTDLQLSYSEMFYNSFFTFLFFPLIWSIFNLYKNIMRLKYD
jgi:rod shape-determining protein MreD